MSFNPSDLRRQTETQASRDDFEPTINDIDNISKSSNRNKASIFDEEKVPAFDDQLNSGRAGRERSHT